MNDPGLLCTTCGRELNLRELPTYRRRVILGAARKRDPDVYWAMRHHLNAHAAVDTPSWPRVTIATPFGERPMVATVEQPDGSRERHVIGEEVV